VHSCLRVSADDPLFTQLGFGAAALRYAAMGYAVLPLAPRAKRPHPMLGHTGGVHLATRDPATIGAWWQHDRTAGIGIACGQASSLVVIDLDVKHGAEGAAELAKFLSDNQISDWPQDAPMALTPSGGLHLYLRWPPAWRLLVTGSRTWTDAASIAWALGLYWAAGFRILVHGACPAGADAIADHIWRSWGGQTEPHRADWATGRGAGFARNTEMAASRPDACLVFGMECTEPACRRPGPHTTHGTGHCASEAEAHGVPVWRVPGQVPVPPPAQLAGRLSILPGVDIKGDGGYVAAAPSMISVQPLTRPGEVAGPVLVPYQWITGCPCTLPPAPRWLGQWMATAPAVAHEGSGGGGDETADLDWVLAHGLPPGERNITLYRIACSLYRRNGTDAKGCEVVDRKVSEILAETERRGACHDFGAGEVATILRSAHTWVSRQLAEAEQVYQQGLAMTERG
jgi:Bifunctional DNA primase/polymerase, N-terminal